MVIFWQRIYIPSLFVRTGGCFTSVSRALQNNLAKIYNARNDIYGENFKLKLCTCAQSMALGTRAKFQLEILIRSMNSTKSLWHKFRENILESSRNVSETTPWILSVTCEFWFCFAIFCCIALDKIVLDHVMRESALILSGITTS